MGGRSITDHITPEAVHLKDIRGLIPPWQSIDQKGATQDGVTFVTALYDPMEIEAVVEARGRNPQYTRRVVNDLVASLDPIQTSKLSFFTQEEGHWWANVRWSKPPEDALEKINTPRQRLALKLRADDAFWRTYDDVNAFAMAYDSVVDLFDVDYSGSQNLGANWPQYYSGAGSGYCSTTSAGSLYTEARWYTSGTAARTVVNGPYLNFDTDTDNQVIEMKIGTRPGSNCWFNFGFFNSSSSYNDLWGRMNRDGSGNWLGNGIRARIGVSGFRTKVILSRFNNFVETVMREATLWTPPAANDKFMLACGLEGDPRQFRVYRNGLTVLSHKEVGTGSSLGSSYRGVGFGMMAGAEGGGFFDPPGQKAPPWLLAWGAGDNSTVSQTGYLARVNIGDQPMYDDYTLFGPGVFRIWDGPNAGANDYIEFGPLLPNQVMFLRSHPGKRGVHDLTVTPPTPQEQNVFQEALDLFLSFAFANNVPPLIQSILSLFGIQPPQGNPYSLLTGRFSDDCAIPPKSPGREAETYYVKCQIDDGNSDSRIIAAGTPLRRYPM
jgi:hypothetical protein